MNIGQDGIRHTKFKFSKSERQVLSEDWKKYVSKIKRCPGSKFSGKGIVYTAGGLSYITCAWVSISLLRERGCDLPVEIWHMGDEVSPGVIRKFQSLDVEFRNFTELGEVTLQGYMLKPLAILGSRFGEIIYIDTDNVCVKDPEYLFETKEYLEYGCIFWPDYWHTAKENSIWSIIGTERFDIPEQESGQLVINKIRCWRELQLCLYFNQMSAYYYRLLMGDKDTFKFAWLALNTDFHMIQKMTGSCGYIVRNQFYGNTMVQHDPAGDILFLHRNLLKWDVTYRDEIVWQVIKTFHNHPSERKIIYNHYAAIGLAIDLAGDVYEQDFQETLGDLEHRCQHFLSRWRESAVYLDFLNHLHFVKNRHR
jgi:alpha 1,2-mannosyltransferase